MSKKHERYLAVGRSVIKEEARAANQLANSIDETFVRACEWVVECQGRVIFTGVGQSFHVARKTACSMASLGRPSFYMHATEAIHGDMGMVTQDDLIILISHSGETTELLKTLGPLQQIGVRTIALVGNLNSTLAENTDLAITTGVDQEAGPIKFAPSSSALVTTALGDAIVMAVADAIGFDAEDYARYHPGGSIGKNLREGA